MSMQTGGKRIELEEGVWAEVMRDFYNPVIKRRELTLIIHHLLRPTPMRITLRLALSERLGVPVERIYVRNLRTEYGIGRTRAIIHIYDTVERALQFEPKHIIDRNGGVSPFEEE